MKKFLTVLFLVSFFILNAQNESVKMGPIIESFGKVYQLENPDLMLNGTTKYKVIFDVYTDNSKKRNLNPLLVKVARFLNMHAQKGVKAENMKIALVLHGAATKSALNLKAYQKKYKTKNQNFELLKALTNANVEVFVCGQSYLANGFQLEEKSENVKMALSALTALVEYQNNGYQIINFN